MEPKNGGFLFNWVMFKFHVNFQGVQEMFLQDMFHLPDVG